jgi:membrane fusion protein (multidrug efflux system)
MADKMEGKPELKAAAPEVAAQPKKKNNSRFLLIIVVAVLAIGGFITYLVLNPSLSTDNATVDRTKATVSTKMLGLIAHIDAIEGQFITKGTPVVKLDAAELQAQKNQAEANVVLVRIDMDRSQSDFNRAQTQYTSKVISTEQFEHAQVAFTQSQKRVDIAQAQLDLINATLGNATISAPFDAVVAKKWMEEGDVLQPGQPILTLYESHKAWITANFEETKIASFKIGQNVEIHVDAYPGVTFHGKVSEIGTNTGNQFSLIPVNNAAGNFTKVTQRIPVKILIDESTDLQDPSVKRLLPGMSATVDVKP